MARRLVAAVSRVFATQPTTDTEHPHFHQGAQGNPAACFRYGCDRPRMLIAA